MTKTINITSRSQKFYLTGLAFLILASTSTGASSTENTFNVKIERASSATVQTSYAAMKKQANKYCTRESRRVSDRGLPGKHRHEYARKCTDEVMGKIVAQIKDSELTAYHKTRTLHAKLDASNTSTTNN